MAEPAAAPSLRLTDRDIEILRWLAGFGGATATQIARRFRSGYSYTSRRLTQLLSAGLLSRERFLYRRGGLYAVTANGLAVLGSDLPVDEPRLAAFEHELAVVDLAIAAELAGARVLTRRQMQTLETPLAGAVDDGVLLYAVQLADEVRHFPDLLLERADGRWAVEVELNDVRGDALEAVLRAYAGAAHLAGVIYHVAPTVRAERIQRVADALALDTRFELHTLTDADEGA